MKLLLCKECQDIIRIIPEEERSCLCGKIKGKYLDNTNAVYSGDSAIPLGFANSTLVRAVNKQPTVGMGENFTAFVIPKECSTFKKIAIT